MSVYQGVLGFKFARARRSAPEVFGWLVTPAHGHAAAELIARLDFYRQFLELIRDIKETQGWTNIERNVYDGLHNPDTLAELTAMTQNVR